MRNGGTRWQLTRGKTHALWVLPLGVYILAFPLNDWNGVVT